MFERMARLERSWGGPSSVRGGAVWLDELDLERGNHDDEPDMERSPICTLAEPSLAAASGRGEIRGMCAACALPGCDSSTSSWSNSLRIPR